MLGAVAESGDGLPTLTSLWEASLVAAMGLSPNTVYLGLQLVVG